MGINDLKLKLYYVQKDLISFANKILLSLVVVVALFLIYKYRVKIFDEFNVLGTIFSTVILAIGLFVFREKQRISYGIAEFIVGLLSVIAIFFPRFDLAHIKFDLFFSIKYLGGVYIMIRGLDNIVKGISSTKTGQILKHKYGIGV